MDPESELSYREAVQRLSDIDAILEGIDFILDTFASGSINGNSASRLLSQYADMLSEWGWYGKQVLPF